MYTKKEHTINEINKTIPFTIASRKIKHLGRSIGKEMQNLYTDNYKTRAKETKEDLNKMERHLIFMDQKTIWLGCQ